MVRVYRDNESYLVIENELIYIVVGVVYFIENSGKFFLEIIEVCIGSYLEEDDIVWIEYKI